MDQSASGFHNQRPPIRSRLLEAIRLQLLNRVGHRPVHCFVDNSSILKTFSGMKLDRMLGIELILIRLNEIKRVNQPIRAA